MPWNSYKRMSNDDLKAVYNYLRSLPPLKTSSSNKYDKYSLRKNG